jgi:hypothetical protein
MELRPNEDTASFWSCLQEIEDDTKVLCSKVNIDYELCIYFDIMLQS